MAIHRFANAAGGCPGVNVATGQNINKKLQTLPLLAPFAEVVSNLFINYVDSEEFQAGCSARPQKSP